MTKPADTFPRSLLSLSDNQLEALMAAAKPLQAADRPAFLDAVAQRLTGMTTLSDGIVHRALAEAQREFLRRRPLDQMRNPWR